jgi:hypothetical protein
MEISRFAQDSLFVLFAQSRYKILKLKMGFCRSVEYIGGRDFLKLLNVVFDCFFQKKKELDVARATKRCTRIMSATPDHEQHEYVCEVPLRICADVSQPATHFMLRACTI